MREKQKMNRNGTDEENVLICYEFDSKKNFSDSILKFFYNLHMNLFRVFSWLAATGYMPLEFQILSEFQSVM